MFQLQNPVCPHKDCSAKGGGGKGRLLCASIAFLCRLLLECKDRGFASLSGRVLLRFSVLVMFYIRKTVRTGRTDIQGALKVVYKDTETWKI